MLYACTAGGPVGELSSVRSWHLDDKQSTGDFRSSPDPPVNSKARFSIKRAGYTIGNPTFALDRCPPHFQICSDSTADSQFAVYLWSPSWRRRSSDNAPTGVCSCASWTVCTPSLGATVVRAAHHMPDHTGAFLRWTFLGSAVVIPIFASVTSRRKVQKQWNKPDCLGIYAVDRLLHAGLCQPSPVTGQAFRPRLLFLRWQPNTGQRFSCRRCYQRQAAIAASKINTSPYASNRFFNAGVWYMTHWTTLAASVPNPTSAPVDPWAEFFFTILRLTDFFRLWFGWPNFFRLRLGRKNLRLIFGWYSAKC